MLIPSHRHTRADLELWRELESADLAHANRPVMARHVERSMQSIRVFAGIGPCYASVSWGKDSVAMAHLLRRAAPGVPLVNLRCTNRNPHCDDVRDAYFRDFSGQAYHEIAVDYSGLHAAAITEDELDRETDRRWYAGFREAERRFGCRHISGIRADESAARKSRMKRWGLASLNALSPVGWWRGTDIFAYLAAHRLPVHPDYAMLGGGRWPREHLRVAEIGDVHGRQFGRREWESEYYGDALRRLESR